MEIICCKCGSSDREVKIRYRPMDEQNKERLCCHCTRCGYDWAQKPLDLEQVKGSGQDNSNWTFIPNHKLSGDTYPPIIVGRHIHPSMTAGTADPVLGIPVAGTGLYFKKD